MSYMTLTMGDVKEEREKEEEEEEEERKKEEEKGKVVCEWQFYILTFSYIESFLDF